MDSNKEIIKDLDIQQKRNTQLSESFQKSEDDLRTMSEKQNTDGYSHKDDIYQHNINTLQNEVNY